MPNQTQKLRENPSEKPSEQGKKPEKKPQPTHKAKPVCFHCEYMGGMVTRENFSSGGNMMRGLLGRWHTRTGTAFSWCV
jgi:hypothetical protein